MKASQRPAANTPWCERSRRSAFGPSRGKGLIEAERPPAHALLTMNALNRNQYLLRIFRCEACAPSFFVWSPRSPVRLHAQICAGRRGAAAERPGFHGLRAVFRRSAAAGYAQAPAGYAAAPMPVAYDTSYRLDARRGAARHRHQPGDTILVGERWF